MHTIVVVDDSEDFLSSAAAMLADEGFDVVGCAITGRGGVELARRLHPAVVLLDVQLPDIDGFEVARQLAQLEAPPYVVLTSSRDAASYGGAVENAPVRGFLAKARLNGAALAALV